MKIHHQDVTRQINILHISDIHFGDTHRFKIPNSADGDSPTDEGYPSLLDSLVEDLRNISKDCPLIVCLTGDFVDKGNIKEFSQAEAFIKGLVESPLLEEVKIENVFIVPGNHDVNYTEDDLGIRFQQYIEFYNRLYGTSIKRDEPQKCQMVFDHSKDKGFIVACLNSSTYVKKGTQDEKRGRIGMADLDSLTNELERIPKENLNSSIKIALIHHHPVLIPSLAEPNRGYDAVHNSDQLISILKQFRFHIILHGHKHNPHTFTEDILPAYKNNFDSSLLIVAGGSIGSTELPRNPNCTNSYNQITVKYHPKGEQTRIRVETRGLNMFDKAGNKMLPTRWRWELMKVDDKHFFAKNNVPLVATNESIRSFTDEDMKEDSHRINVYRSSRGNLPVLQVLPSLEPNQAYEAIIWIVQHPYEEEKPQEDTPEKVVYSAGKKFEVIEVHRNQGENFTAKITYWGPMLIQVKMLFEDGVEYITHVYARMPNQY